MMTCTLCRHPQRAEIDRALLAQEPLRPIAARHATSTGSLRRHRKCIGSVLARVKAKQEVVVAEHVEAEAQLEKDTAQQAQDALREIYEIVRRAGNDDDKKLRAFDRVLKFLDLRGRARHEFGTGGTTINGDVNVLLDGPAWAARRSRIIAALAHHDVPEQVRARVIAAFNGTQAAAVDGQFVALEASNG